MRRDPRRIYDELARELDRSGSSRLNLRGASTGSGDVISDQDKAWKSPLTAAGSLIEGGESGAAVELPIGDAGDVLTVTDIGAGELRPRWAPPSGGGGGAVAIEDDGVAVSAAVTSIDFKAPLTVTEPVADQVEIDVDVGTGATQVAAGDHLHTGVYSPVGHTHVAADVTDFAEAVDDRVGTLVVDSSSIDVTYNDAGNAESIAVIDSYIQDLIDETLEDIEGDEVFASPGNWLFRHKWGEVYSTPNAGTMSFYGYIASAGATQGSAAAADDADGNWAQFTTLGSVGLNGGKNASTQLYRADWHLSYGSLIKTGPDITSVRYIMGMANSGGNVNSSDTPAAHGAWFRYSTAVPDTNWICVTGDGTNRTETDSGVAVTADTRYSFRIHFGTVKAKFYIDDVLVATHTTNMPASGTGLGWWATLTTLAASSRIIKLSRIWLASIY